MLIAEELLLLALDDQTGTARIGREKLDPALAGALVAELALMERIGVTPRESGWWERGRVTVTSLTPTDDVELDRALAVLQEREGKKIKDLVSATTGKRPLAKDLRDRLLERLAASGTLRAEHGTVLGVIPRTTWPAVDRTAEDEVRSRLQSALVSGLTPTERTVSLIALLSVTGLLTKVVSTPDREAKQRVKARGKALTDGDWVAQAVRDAIQEAQAAGASAAAAGAG